jgi:hypothetical protein
MRQEARRGAAPLNKQYRGIALAPDPMRLFPLSHRSSLLQTSPAWSEKRRQPHRPGEPIRLVRSLASGNPRPRGNSC